MRRPLEAILAGGTLALASVASAQAPAPTMNSLDTDRDGSLSRYEASAVPGLVGQFQTLDANQNGALESAEFSRFESTGAGATAPAGGTLTPPPPMGATPPPSTLEPAPGVPGTHPPRTSTDTPAQPQKP